MLVLLSICKGRFDAIIVGFVVKWLLFQDLSWIPAFVFRIWYSLF